MAKGMTAVVTIILLLLMAVAAVGGAYLWFGRFQSETQASVSTQMESGVSSQAGALTILSAYGSATTAASGTSPNPQNSLLEDDFNYWCSYAYLVASSAVMKDRGATACVASTGNAKISLVAKNTGTTDIAGSSVVAQNDVGQINVLVDGKSVKFHIDNGTDSSYNSFLPVSWKQGEVRRIDVDYNCSQIAAKADKRIKLDVVPKKGSSSSKEMTCKQCCAALGASQAACDATC